MAEPTRILVVDDAPEYAAMVVELLRASDAWKDAVTATALTYDDALRVMTAQRFDIALFDYMLGARDGLSLLREVRQRGIDTAVVVLTGRGAEEIAVEAMKSG
ncbi:MAG: hypothetical protein DMF97_06595, partial [Acidobacteria bacterium]